MLVQQRPEFDSVMIDLETMGTGPAAAVIQIGAAAFNSKTGDTDPSRDFLTDVDLTSSLMLGGYTDESTVRWWRDRGGFPKTGPAREMRTALINLATWFKNYPDLKRVWAQGPSFDIAILEGYYRRAKLPCPWAYAMPRDTRTVYDLAKERDWKKPATEVAHEARQDCRLQIVTVMSALGVLREPPKTS